MTGTTAVHEDVIDPIFVWVEHVATFATESKGNLLASSALLSVRGR